MFAAIVLNGWLRTTITTEAYAPASHGETGLDSESPSSIEDGLSHCLCWSAGLLERAWAGAVDGGERRIEHALVRQQAGVADAAYLFEAGAAIEPR